MSKSLVSVVALGWFLVTPVGSQTRSHDYHSHEVGSQFGRLMSAAMHKMHEEMAAAPQTGDPDHDFLAMMIPHHAGAVEMARLLLMYGRDPLVRQLAEEIITGQQSEIAGMRARLRVLDNGPDPRPDGFPAVSGTRGE
jgi:uncharacterized protein (DUF305 family)